MPPKAGKSRGKKLAGKYRNQKRKAEENEDLEVQEDSTESPTRERRGENPRKMSALVQVKLQSGPQRVQSLLSGLKGLLSSLKGLLSSPKSPGIIHLLPILLVTDSPNPWMMKVNIYNLFLVYIGSKGGY